MRYWRQKRQSTLFKFGFTMNIQNSKFYVLPVSVLFLWQLKIKELLRNFWYYNLLI